MQTVVPYFCGYQFLSEKWFLFVEICLRHRFLHEDLLTRNNPQDHIPFVVMLFVNPPHPDCRDPQLPLHHHNCNCMLSLCFVRPFLALGVTCFSTVVILNLVPSCMVFYNCGMDIPSFLVCFFGLPLTSPSSS